MRVVAILNQKGGVGKTTTAVNLGAALALRGRRVLLVDLDPQGNLTDHLGVGSLEDEATIYDVLTAGTPLVEAAIPTATERLEVIPGDEDLAAVEVEIADRPGRETLLRRAVAAAPKDRWDWILVDCPPSLGLLTLNAMAACREVFITLQTEYFALRGLGQLSRIVSMVQQGIHPEVRITGIVTTMVNPVTNLAREVIEEVKRHFPSRVFHTRVRQNVRLAEAPGHGQHIFEYAPGSAGAADYRALAEEVETTSPAGLAPPVATAERPPSPGTPGATSGETSREASAKGDGVAR